MLSGSRLIVLSLAGASVPPGHAQDSRYVVRVVLNSAVMWALDLAGGTQRTMADLRGGTVTGVAGGTVLTPPGWATATSRIDLDATSGFSQLTVSRWSAPGS